MDSTVPKCVSQLVHYMISGLPGDMASVLMLTTLTLSRTDYNVVHWLLCTTEIASSYGVLLNVITDLICNQYNA